MEKILKLILASIAIAFILPLNAQEDKIDSLKLRLKSETNTKQKIDLLHQIVWEEAQTNPKSSIELAKKSLTLSEKIVDSTLIARSYNRIGLVYDYAGSFNLAEKNYLKALKIKTSCDGAEETDGLLNNLGSVYYYTGNYEKAMVYYLKSLRIREKKKNVEPSEKLKSIAQSYNNIGLLLKSQSNYKEALKYYYKGVKIKEQLKDYSGLIITLSNIGVIQMQQGSISDAEASFNRAINLSDSLDDVASQAMLFNNMGLMYTRVEDWSKAKTNYLSAIKIYEFIDDKYGNATAMVNLASVEWNLKNYSEARLAGLKALDYARQNKAPRVELSALQVLAEIEEQTNPQKALFYLNQYISLKDSVQDALVSNKINQLAVMYETEQKETEIELLKQDKALSKQESRTKDLIIRRNRIYTYALVAGIVVVLLLSYVLILYLRSKRRAAEERADKLHEQHQREIDTLRNTIERQLEAPEQQIVGIKINQSELNTYLLNPLSDRELDVLSLIADGMTNKEIGEQLFISVNTVKSHVLNIYEKLGVQNRTAAAVKANSLQIIQ